MISFAEVLKQSLKSLRKETRPILSSFKLRRWVVQTVSDRIRSWNGYFGLYTV